MILESRTNKLSIYMIKPEYRRFDEVVDTLQAGQVIEGIGTFYSEDSFPHPPSWIRDFFDSTLGDNLHITTSSARGMLLSTGTYNGEEVIFAVSFGFGRFLLRDGVFEERFGLKVVLNSVDSNSLRSIDKTTLGSIPKHSREQISRDGIAADFGIDIEQDLISSVTGKSKDQKLGKIITGKDALSVSVKVNIHNIKGFLGYCLERYKSQDYKKDFSWIDQITEIRAPKQAEALNQQLLEKLNKEEFDKIWMAVPEIVDWVNIKGFRYSMQAGNNLEDDLDIHEFLASCAGQVVDVNLLKNTFVHGVSPKSDEVVYEWSSYRCFYAELESSGKVNRGLVNGISKNCIVD